MKQSTLEKWEDYNEEFFENFLENNGGIVGIMMDENQKALHDLVPHFKLIDAYKEEEYCYVQYSLYEKEVEQLLTNYHIKVSINGKDFCVSKIEYILEEGIKSLGYVYSINGKREDPYTPEYGYIADVMDLNGNRLLAIMINAFLIDKFEMLFEDIFQIKQLDNE